MGGLPLATCIGHIREVCDTVNGMIKKARKANLTDEEKASFTGIEESYKDLLENWPSFDYLREKREEVAQRFRKNQVSEGFPLYYLPAGSFFPSLFSVSLDDSVEVPDHVPKILEYVKLGLGVERDEDVPENIMAQVTLGTRWNFGRTRRRLDLGELLSVLPEPKTLITDLYIVDCFPELEGRIEPHEFDDERLVDVLVNISEKEKL